MSNISNIELKGTKYQIKDSTSRERLAQIHVFQEISEMQNADLQTGYRAQTFHNGHMNNWVISTTANTFNRRLKNGLYANLLGRVDMGGIDYNNFSETINEILIDSLNIYIPKGTYIANIFVVKPDTELYGDGVKTKLLLNSVNGTVLRILADNAYVHDLYIMGDSFFADSISSTGIYLKNVNRCTFERLRVENFSYGILGDNRLIWNSFTDVRVIGCKKYCLLFRAIEKGYQMNNNIFMHCEFNTSCSSIFSIQDSNHMSWNNVCMGCNFETDFSPVGSVAPSVNKEAMLSLTGQCDFISCYMENARYYLLSSTDTVSIQNCFIGVMGKCEALFQVKAQSSLQNCYGYQANTVPLLTGASNSFSSEFNNKDIGLPSN